MHVVDIGGGKGLLAEHVARELGGSVHVSLVDLQSDSATVRFALDPRVSALHALVPLHPQNHRPCGCLLTSLVQNTNASFVTLLWRRLLLGRGLRHG